METLKKLFRQFVQFLLGDYDDSINGPECAADPEYQEHVRQQKKERS